MIPHIIPLHSLLKVTCSETKKETILHYLSHKCHCSICSLHTNVLFTRLMYTKIHFLCLMNKNVRFTCLMHTNVQFICFSHMNVRFICYRLPPPGDGVIAPNYNQIHFTNFIYFRQSFGTKALRSPLPSSHV